MDVETLEHAHISAGIKDWQSGRTREGLNYTGAAFHRNKARAIVLKLINASLTSKALQADFWYLVCGSSWDVSSGFYDCACVSLMLRHLETPCAASDWMRL